MRRLLDSLWQRSVSQLGIERRRAAWALFAALVLLVSLLHLFVNADRIGHKELWEDEVATYVAASRPLGEVIAGASIAAHSQPQAFYIATNLLLRVTAAEWAVRGLSWVFTLALLYLIIFGLTELGLFARFAMAVFLCLGGLTFYFAREFRPYALLALTSFAATILLLRMLAAPGERRRAIAYFVVALVLLYSHAFACWTFAAHGLYVGGLLVVRAIRRGPRETLREQRWVIVALAALVLCYLPYLYLSMGNFNEAYGHLAHRRSLQKSLQAALVWSHYKAAFVRFAQLPGAFAYLVGGVVVAALLDMVRRRDPVLILWLLLTVGHVAFVHGFLAGRSFYAERYLTPAYPAFCFLFALGLDRILRAPPRLAWLALAAGLALAALETGTSFAAHAGLPLPQGFWRQRAAELRAVPGPKMAFFETGWLGQVMQYQTHGDPDVRVVVDRQRFYPPSRHDKWDPQLIDRLVDQSRARTACYLYYIDGMPQGRELKGRNSPYLRKFLPAMKRIGYVRAFERRLRGFKRDTWTIHAFCRPDVAPRVR